MDEKILRTLARLPEVTREKVIRLQNDRETASGGAKRAAEMVQEASNASYKAKLAYDREERARGPRMAQLGKRNNPHAQAEANQVGAYLEELRQVVAQHADEMTRRQMAYHRAREHFNSVGNLWSRVANFLESLGPRLTPVDPPKVPLKKGESYPGAVDSIREEIANYKTEIERMKRAPVTTQEALSRAKAYCARLRATCGPDIDNFYRVDGDGPVGWPERIHHVFDVHGTQQTSSVRAPDVAAMMAWLFPEQFEAALLRTVESAGDDEVEQLPLNGRDLALRGMADDLEILERKEEALIDAAEAEGTVILRRADARVEVVLGVLLHHDILADAA